MPPLSNRAPGSSLSLVLIEPPAHVRGPVPGLSNRAPGSSLPLVLIEPPAHVRGPVPGLSIRPLAARYRSCSSNRQRTSAGVAPQAIRGAWPRGTIRAKGRRLNAASVRTISSRARRRRVKFFAQLSTKESWQGRWCPVGTVQRLVSAAASVGDGRSPLGCITRGGSREGGQRPQGLGSVSKRRKIGK